MTSPSPVAPHAPTPLTAYAPAPTMAASPTLPATLAQLPFVDVAAAIRPPRPACKHRALSRWSILIVKGSIPEHKAGRIADGRVHSKAHLPTLQGHAVQHDAAVCCICARKSLCKSPRPSQRLQQHSKSNARKAGIPARRMAMVSCAPGPGQPTPQRRCGRGLSPGGVGGTLRCSLLAASVRPAGRPACVCTTRHRSRTMRLVSVSRGICSSSTFQNGTGLCALLQQTCSCALLPDGAGGTLCLIATYAQQAELQASSKGHHVTACTGAQMRFHAVKQLVSKLEGHKERLHAQQPRQSSDVFTLRTRQRVMGAGRIDGCVRPTA